MAESKYVKIPKLIERRSYFEDGANIATEVEVHKCICGKGRIEHHYVPGFDDDWYEFLCEDCEGKYHPFIDRSGKEWIVYLI